MNVLGHYSPPRATSSVRPEYNIVFSELPHPIVCGRQFSAACTHHQLRTRAEQPCTIRESRRGGARNALLAERKISAVCATRYWNPSVSLGSVLQNKCGRGTHFAMTNKAALKHQISKTLVCGVFNSSCDCVPPCSPLPMRTLRHGQIPCGGCVSAFRALYVHWRKNITRPTPLEMVGGVRSPQTPSYD